MFTKKQLDVYFDFAFTDLANALAYWENQKESGNQAADNHIQGILGTREFLEVSRKNIVEVSKRNYVLQVNADHPDKSYIHGSIELVKSILAFGAIKFVTTKKPTYDNQNVSARSKEPTSQIEESVPDSVIPVDSDSGKHDIVSSELPTGD